MSRPDKTLFEHAEEELKRKTRARPRTRELDQKETAMLCFRVELDRIAKFKALIALNRSSNDTEFDKMLKMIGI